MTFSFREILDEVEKMIWSKRTWIESFSTGKSKRPDHEIETKTREVAVLERVATDYRRASGRQS